MKGMPSRTSAAGRCAKCGKPVKGGHNARTCGRIPAAADSRPSFPAPLGDDGSETSSSMTQEMYVKFMFRKAREIREAKLREQRECQAYTPLGNVAKFFNGTRLAVAKDDPSFRNALVEFYATPAGYSVFALRAEQNMKRTDLLGHVTVDVEEFKREVDEYRRLHPEVANPAVAANGFREARDGEGDAAGTDLGGYVAMSGVWGGKLTEGEALAFRWYTSNGFEQANSWLHGGEDAVNANVNVSPTTRLSEGEVFERVDRMRSAIRGNPLPTPVCMHRGLDVQHFDEAWKRLNGVVEGDAPEMFQVTEEMVRSEFVEGGVWTMRGFGSASMSERVAEGFAGSGVMLEIVGVSAAPVGGVSSFGWSEQEMLLCDGVSFNVESVSGSEDAGFVVRLREVGV